MPTVGKGSMKKEFGYDVKGRTQAKAYAKTMKTNVVKKKKK